MGVGRFQCPNSAALLRKLFLELKEQSHKCRLFIFYRLEIISHLIYSLQWEVQMFGTSLKQV